MPEISEVATTAEILFDNLADALVEKIVITAVGKYKTKNPEGFDNIIKDLPLVIKNVDSKGKFMWFELQSVTGTGTGKIYYLYNTFGLNGYWSFERHNNCRLSILLADGRAAYFMDSINYSTFKFSTDINEFNAKIASLTPDLLKDSDFDMSKILKYKKPIVKVLLDQKNSIGSGIGNYLSSEILYKAGISPHRIASTLTKEEIEKLSYAIKYMIKLSYLYNDVRYLPGLVNYIDNYEKKDYHPDIKIVETKFTHYVYSNTNDKFGNNIVAEKIVKTGNTWRTTYWVPDLQK
jgi:formamidopyrimidine-DNA glycosylase